MHIPLAPYEFVAHGTDQGGISQLEWILDGTSLGIVDAKNSAEKLATFMYLWTPPGPGTYTLQVRAKTSANKWSDLDEAVFFVGDTTPTVTLIPSDTPTPRHLRYTYACYLRHTHMVGSYCPTLTVTTPTETKTPMPEYSWRYRCR